MREEDKEKDKTLQHTVSTAAEMDSLSHSSGFACDRDGVNDKDDTSSARKELWKPSARDSQSVVHAKEVRIEHTRGGEGGQGNQEF